MIEFTEVINNLNTITNYLDNTIKPLLNADGCEGCAFMDTNEWEMPCAKCKRNCMDYWRAKVVE